MRAEAVPAQGPGREVLGFAFLGVRDGEPRFTATPLRGAQPERGPGRSCGKRPSVTPAPPQAPGVRPSARPLPRDRVRVGARASWGGGPAVPPRVAAKGGSGAGVGGPLPDKPTAWWLRRLRSCRPCPWAAPAASLHAVTRARPPFSPGASVSAAGTRGALALTRCPASRTGRPPALGGEGPASARCSARQAGKSGISQSPRGARG